jgi:hypothetical protein
VLVKITQLGHPTPTVQDHRYGMRPSPRWQSKLAELQWRLTVRNAKRAFRDRHLQQIGWRPILSGQ